MSKNSNRKNKNSLVILTIFYCITGTVNSMVAPFLTIHIANISGGMDKLGIALSITVLLSAATVAVAGSYSDKVGRVPFLIASAYVDAAVFVSYIFVSHTYQIFILQALVGIVGTVAMVMAQALLADLTETGGRGQQIGRMMALMSVSGALGLICGGYAVKFFGLKTLLLMASAVIVFSTPLLFVLRRLQSPLNPQPGPEPDGGEVVPLLAGVTQKERR